MLSRQAVRARCQQHIETALHRQAAHLFQTRPIQLQSAVAIITKLLDDLNPILSCIGT